MEKALKLIGKIIPILGIVVAIAMIVFSAAYPVPDKYIRVGSSYYGYEWSENRGNEYVGGDAYNYQMEASLKAGYMSGILAMKSVMFVGGVLLLFVTLYSGMKRKVIEEQTKAFSECMAEQTKTALKEMSEKADQLIALKEQDTTEFFE